MAMPSTTQLAALDAFILGAVFRLFVLLPLKVYDLHISLNMGQLS